MEKKYPLIDKQKVSDRLQDIERAVKELEYFKAMNFKEFQQDKNNFPLASYWLRIAIEAVLTIATHILSRLPSNGKKKDYTQAVLSLGDYGVIPKKFADKIRGMPGYRNRLVHLYWKIEPDELYRIISNEINDFRDFHGFIRKYLKLIY